MLFYEWYYNLFQNIKFGIINYLEKKVRRRKRYLIH